ncbi:efflux RND transporter periplasmic adaptor subunit [Pseudoflavitalea sp. G-6-1-2]|uniref:efflux RND transporter periplasmic adaptor subunit n=1 Tax=Pseudoflavitalea sp. G-6-1-2 TaxID=2728841 RepID=UPI00146A7D72|nr:efflux RND transporter periplasmic adaptor subunit [Pseudoflavitalea sp. G-6-1-2]NML22598.1 efflux RND transporter periplasmic adaptor subunit [Pseudoflavitalea sp. G-6-1-2]
MQKSTLHSWILASAITASLMACSPKKQESGKPAPAADPAPVPALPVDILVASESPLQQSETVAGSLMPDRSVEITAELMKKITAVLFRDGSYVQAGQTLYSLDNADILARIRQLKADLQLAAATEKRLNALLKTETVRQEEYDIALAKLQSLQAAEEVLQVELSKTTIKAPFSGRIGISKVFTGTLVNPGMPLVRLEDQHTLKVSFSIGEKYLSLVKPGTRIQFTTVLSDEKVNAVVVSAEASVDLSSRNIVVQATVANNGEKLKAGMSVKVSFPTTPGNAKGVMIPTEALIPGGNGYSVFLVKNGVAKITGVTVGSRNESQAQINAGIVSGDTVMISNMLRASDGMPVSPVIH